MHSKNGRVNSDFQITHFIAGGCSTYDGAYAALREQEHNRKTALAFAHASMKQSRAKLMVARWAKRMFFWLPPVRLWCEGYLEVFESQSETHQLIFQAAYDELETIRKLIEKIEPFRKFKHLSDREAFQACERDEWAGELIRRAENQMAALGHLASDDLNTMRNHPDFGSVIGPRIQMLLESKAVQLSSAPLSQHLLSFEPCQTSLLTSTPETKPQ